MHKQKRIFITGTDTDVGKTLVTSCLIEKLQQSKYSVTAIKPVAAGCDWLDGQLKNSDALTLQRSMQQSMDYERINPIALKPPIAPHIAAAKENLNLSVLALQKKCDLSQYQSDFVLVEGAGGWLVPLNDSETLADFVVAESMDVIMVVGMKLGCINHAMLTVQTIKESGLNIIAWVANIIDPDMLMIEENIKSIKQRIEAPLIATIPYIESDNIIQQAHEYVNISPLVNRPI